MEKSIKDYLGSLKLGEVQQCKNLAMVPLVSGYDDGLDYLTLGEALDAGSVEIRELSEGGSVPELRVLNRSGKMVLILDGEALVGAKQNRIVNTTILIAEGDIVIPVSCVEQGRWQYQTRTFHSKQRVMNPSIRMRKAMDVALNLKESGRFRADQRNIWEEVSEMALRRGAVSETMDLDLVYEKESVSTGEYIRGFVPVDGQVGAVFLVNGSVTGLDAFGKAGTFAKVFRNLVESYALDAVDRFENEAPGRGVKAAASKMLEGLATAITESRPSVGLGTDLRFESEKLFGFALEYRERVLHLCLFPNSGSNPGARQYLSRMASHSTRRQRRGL